MLRVHWQPPPIYGGKSRFLSSILGSDSPFQDGISRLYADFAATAIRWGPGGISGVWLEILI